MTNTPTKPEIGKTWFIIDRTNEATLPQARTVPADALRFLEAYQAQKAKARIINK